MPDTANSIRQRRTPQELVAAAKTVKMMLALYKALTQSDPGSRWSRMTLYLTQGWHFEDRLKVFRLAMVLDERAVCYENDATPTSANRARMEDRVRVFGEDGGVDVQI